MCFILTLANYLSYVNNPENKFAHLTQFYSTTSDQIILAETAEHVTGNSVIMKIKGFVISDSLYVINGKFLMRRKNFRKTALKQNATYLVKGNFKRIETKKALPGEFNFENFLKQKSVVSQIDASTILFISENSRTFFSDVKKSVYNRIEAKFQSDSVPEQVKIICRALLIGDDSGLEESLLSAYSSTGTLHVLAVSGMHVGIVFSIFQLIFKLLGNKKRIRFAKFLVVVFCIWIYAFITGFSSSILRAVIMLSVFLIAEVIGRKSKGLNALFVSAFIMVFVDPYFLFDLGFQLSMTAVFGILLYYQFFKKQFISRWKVMTWVGDMVAVTLSAQVFTWPLSLYYFHQFPLLFVPANLLIVPLSTLCLFSCLIWIFLCPFSLMSIFFSSASVSLIAFMNNVAVFISELSFSSIQAIHFSELDLIFSYVLILLFFNSVQNKKRLLLFLTLILLVVQQSVHLIDKAVNSKRRFLYAICTGNKYALLLVYNSRAIVVNTGLHKVSPKKISGFLAYSGFSKVREIDLLSGYHIIRFGGKKIVLISASQLTCFEIGSSFDYKFIFQFKKIEFEDFRNKNKISDNLFISHEF